MTTTIFAPLTVEDIMELLPGLTRRAIKEVLRQHGCASEIRGKLFVSLDQFRRLLKETDLCRLRSNGETASPNSTEQLEADAFERALELATQKSQPIRRRRGKRVSSEPISTAPITKPRLLTPLSST